jgi:hypothetical protein
VIHWFNEIGPADLGPRWAGGCPRWISTEDEGFIFATAAARPYKLGVPFTWWGLCRLVGYLARSTDRVVGIGRGRLRQIVCERGISFQRTRQPAGTGRCGAPPPCSGVPQPELLVSC